ncbi:MAG: Hsp20 family protein [Nitrospira sp.]|nr:Hsp20 family protein [Nitrospira sp.]HRA95821.1 Hsp20 family protein [Nitrospira sp.]
MSGTVHSDADGSKVAADYKDGILNVHLPKLENAQPTSIEVTVA